MARKGKGRGLKQLALVVAGMGAGAAVALLLVIYYLGYERPPVPRPEAYVPAYQPPVAPLPPPETAPPPGEPVPVIPRPRARLAIVIDDMGPDIRKLRELVQIGEPITIAVMPNMRYSAETSKEARAIGLDVIVHMPMEPKDSGGHNPGGDALLVAMTPSEIKARMEEGMRSVPGAIGINNHMGSRFTEDEQRMRTVLEVLKDRQMIFLDSRTTPDSVAGRLARDLGLKSADRNVFLDNTRDVAYIKGQLKEAARMARRNGRAVAIGHPYPETLKALKEAVPELEAEGVEVVGISEVAVQGNKREAPRR